LTTAAAQFYWSHHPPKLEVYRASGDEPHRDWAVAAVGLLTPHGRVLEVGCHCGPLLHRLVAAGYEASGLDINAGAVRAARAAGLDAMVGAVPHDLANYFDDELDVVVSSYCLAYIAPPDLPAVLNEMLRIAVKGLVIVEPMAGAGVVPAVRQDSSYTEWRHDYFDALASATRPVRMTRYARGPFADINGVVVVQRG
jgi:SAM-dependent methyltransferase